MVNAGAAFCWNMEVIKVDGCKHTFKNLWTQIAVRAIGGLMITAVDIQASVETDALRLPIRLRRRYARAKCADVILAART
jgi:hypothetical protein